MAQHLSFGVVFDVPEGKEFRSKFGSFYDKVRSGTTDALYYGFAVCGNKVLCREGYTSLKGVAQHGADVKEEFAAVLSEVGKERIRILNMSPPADIPALKSHLGDYTSRLIELDGGAIAPTAMPKGCKDTHVSLFIEFTVPDGKMDEFKAGFSKFYDATKNGAGADGCLYYGFGTEGNSVFCREGYKDAATCGKHAEDVKGMIEEPMKAIGAGGLKINVVGPKEELDKMRARLEPRGAVFWELDDGALWR